MSLSKKKFTFKRKKSEIKDNNNNFKEKNFENEINENNKYFSNKNLLMRDLIFSKEKEENEDNILKILDNKENEIKPLNTEKNEEKKISDNPELQYLINQNERENIDFINTLLKLKGISINPVRNFSSSKNIEIISNIEKENFFIPKSTKNVIKNNVTRNDKSTNSNGSNSTTKINTMTNNCKQNDNEEEETTKNIQNSKSSSNDIYNSNFIFNKNKEQNNLDSEVTKNEEIIINNDKIKIFKNDNQIIIKEQNNNTISKKIENENLEDNNPKSNEKNNIDNNKSNENILVKENSKNNGSINDLLNEKMKNKIYKKNTYKKIPRNPEKYNLNNKCLTNRNSSYRDSNDISEQSEDKITKKNSLKKTSILSGNNDHIKHTINNAINNNQNSKKLICNKKIVKRQKSMKNKNINNNNNIKKRNDYKIKNFSRIIKSNEFLKKNNSSKILLTTLKNDKIEHNKNINYETKTASKVKSKKDNIIKNFIIDKIDNKISLETKKAYDNSNIKDEQQNTIIKNLNYKKMIMSNRKKEYNLINSNISYDKFYSGLSFITDRKENKAIKNKEYLKHKFEISPNKYNNISIRNSPKYKYNNDENSYSKIAMNKMCISPSNKSKIKKSPNKYNIHKIELYKMNEIKNLESINFKNKNLTKIIDKSSNCSNSKLFKKLNEISPPKNENLDKTIDLDDEDFNDDGIQEKKESNNNKVKKSMKAEIFLFDKEEDIIHNQNNHNINLEKDNKIVRNINKDKEMKVVNYKEFLSNYDE